MFKNRSVHKSKKKPCMDPHLNDPVIVEMQIGKLFCTSSKGFVEQWVIVKLQFKPKEDTGSENLIIYPER